jgi:glycine hydroxymethyltransferase
VILRLENAVAGDASAQVPGGIRLGTSALTSRSMKEEDIRVVAEFLHRAVQLALVIQKEAGSKLLKDFERVATSGDGEGAKAVKTLCKEVRAFAKKWPLPGVDTLNLQKPEGFEGDDA